MNTSTNQAKPDVTDKCFNFENDAIIHIESCQHTTMHSSTQNEIPIMASINDNICSQAANATEQSVVKSSTAAHDLNS